MNREGCMTEERWTQHNAASIAELITWLRDTVSAEPTALAVAIELPCGAIVETLMESGFPVFSINPKQLDRFRDRYSPAGAKDDSRDAFVLADSLRTDQHCFSAVRLDEPPSFGYVTYSLFLTGVVQKCPHALLLILAGGARF